MADSLQIIKHEGQAYKALLKNIGCPSCDMLFLNNNPSTMCYPHIKRISCYTTYKKVSIQEILEVL